MTTPAMVTVNGTLNPFLGASRVRFRITDPVRYGAGPDVILPQDLVATVNPVTGTFSLPVFGTDDPAWSPIGWSYRITVEGDNLLYTFYGQVPYNVSPINFGTIMPSLTPAQGAAYAPIAHQHTSLVGPLTVTNDVTANGYSMTATGAGYFKATDQNFVGWTFDPAQAQAGTIMPTAGLAMVARIRVLASTINNIHMHMTAGGTSLTAGQCFAAIYNDAGTSLLGISADQAANWTGGGYKTTAMVTPVTGLTIGSYVKAVFWANTAGTLPTISRAGNIANVLVNANLVSPNFRFASANAGLTTTPPGALGTLTSTLTAWWVGLS